jgi:hypothetical protein
MAGLFSLAAQKASQMAKGNPDPITIDTGPFKVKIPMADGGLSSVQKNISIKGQPHELSYITPFEGKILEDLGGSGNKVNGIPAYYMGGDFGQSWSDAESKSNDSYLGGGLGWDTVKYDPQSETVAMLADPYKDIGNKINLLVDDSYVTDDKEGYKTKMPLNDPETEKAKEAMRWLAEENKKWAMEQAEKGAEEKKDSGLTEKKYNELINTVGPRTKSQNKQLQKYRQGTGLLNLVQKGINRQEYSQRYDVPFANKLEKLGLATFGKGMRGWAELDMRKAVTRDVYDPEIFNAMNPETGKGALVNEFELISKQFPNLSPNEIMARMNENDPSVQRYGRGKITARDIAGLGLTLTNPIGPQQNYIESSRFRGFGKGLALIGSALTGGPIAAGNLLTDSPGLFSSIWSAFTGSKGKNVFDKINRVGPEQIGKGINSLGPTIFGDKYMKQGVDPTDDTPIYHQRGFTSKFAPEPRWVTKVRDSETGEVRPENWQEQEKRLAEEAQRRNATSPFSARSTGGQVEDKRSAMEKYYNIDPDKDEWYTDEDRKAMEEHFKDFPLDTDPNYSENQLRILAYVYPDLFQAA